MSTREWFLLVWNVLLVALSFFFLWIAVLAASWGSMSVNDFSDSERTGGYGILGISLIFLILALFILREVVRYVRASAYWQLWWKKAKMARASLFSK